MPLLPKNRGNFRQKYNFRKDDLYMAPIIGITYKSETRDIENYTNAIKAFKGDPLLFRSFGRTVQEHRASIREYLAAIDGLLLPGGGDINPALYFEERHLAVRGVSRSRDALEIWLCRDALDADIPILGICRGIQVMSVVTRGNLYQDIPAQFSDHLPHKVKHGDSWHDIEIQPRSLLNQITDENSTKINSSHHQSVKDIGDGFVVTARSSDGVIEAIENPSKKFVLGVQYHPERMLKKPEFEEHGAKLFNAFIKACT